MPGEDDFLDDFMESRISGDADWPRDVDWDDDGRFDDDPSPYDGTHSED